MSDYLNPFFRGLQKTCSYITLAFSLFLMTLSLPAYANKTPERVNKIHPIIDLHDAGAVTAKNIELDVWKLKALSLKGEAQDLSDLALQIHRKYDQKNYTSDQQFGDTMLQVVSAFTETQEISHSFEIVQRLQKSVHDTPNIYLDFIIDRCLMEIYIKTFDFKRALEIELRVLNNPDYTSLDIFSQWEPSLFNEIAFSYNQLGDGERALEYLDHAKTAYEESDLSSLEILQAKALNMGNRGQAYLLMGNFAEAEKIGWDVLELGQTLKQNYFVTLGYRLLGNAAHNLGQHEQAKKMLEAGIELADTHNIETLKKHLYNDYAVSLENLGQYRAALLWQRKQFLLEIEAEKSRLSANQVLQNAESNAFESYREVLILRRENEIQRDISDKDLKINKLLSIVALALFTVIGVVAYFHNSLRKKQKKIIRQTTVMETTNDKLKSAALHDPLTGLPNRLFIKSHLDRELASALGKIGKLGVIHIDIDHFKGINDTYGHAAGDFMLVEIAKRMHACKGENMIIARIGGDEFLAVITGIDNLESTETDVKVLLDSISSPMSFEGITLASSASIGISLYPKDSTNSLDLIVNADLALYEAKQDGRGCIRFFEPPMRGILDKRKLLEAELIKGLAEGHIQPYFQPQVNIATNKVCGVEALIRWKHETRGNISPLEFLPVAESSGLMVRLGRFMMDAAIKEAATWHTQNIPFGRLALNASAVELGEDDFVDWLLATAAQHSLPTSMLSIEILETVIIKDARLNLSDTLKRLRSSGIHVELDDFGTGYASLQQVKPDEIDRIKIDRSFIQNLNADKSKAVIVRAIVEMATSLNIDVIAEGAETADELDTLLKLGCVKVQGYGIAAAMPGKVAREWIELFAPNLATGRSKIDSTNTVYTALAG